MRHTGSVRHTAYTIRGLVELPESLASTESLVSAGSSVAREVKISRKLDRPPWSRAGARVQDRSGTSGLWLLLQGTGCAMTYE